MCLTLVNSVYSEGCRLVSSPSSHFGESMCFSPFRSAAVCPGSRMSGFVADHLDHFQNVLVARHSGQNRCSHLSAMLCLHRCKNLDPPLPGTTCLVAFPECLPHLSLSLLIDSPGKLDGRFGGGILLAQGLFFDCSLKTGAVETFLTVAFLRLADEERRTLSSE